MESDIKKEAAHQLQEAVTALYGAFARYPAPGKIQTRWGVALDSDELARLTTKPLHDLQWEDLARYAFKAMSLWGDADDYRYFLPRLLELLVNDPPEYHWGLNEALVLYNVRDAWRAWPEAEQQAIEGYLIALWRYVLAAFDPGRSLAFLQDAPCAIAQLVDDLPYISPCGKKPKRSHP